MKIDNIDVQMSPFALDVMRQKYAHDLPNGEKETWPQIAVRVATNVLNAAPVKIPSETVKRVAELIAERKFIPGGRYLYASGRPFHQVQNCLLLRAEDSREGWADLMQKATMALMTGAGIGVVYSDVRPEGTTIKRTGGKATGPLALMQMLNEAGRGIMQGGSRRSAIWAGLHWNHPDIFKFIQIKNWSPEVRALKEKDFNFPATLDGTNISVILDDDFFTAYDDPNHKDYSLAHNVYWATVRQMLKTAEPGFSIDVGPNRGENLRNAPVAGDTMVLTDDGYRRVIEIVDTPATVWTGKRWARNVVFKKTGENVETVKVEMTGGRSIVCDPTHEFLVERYEGAGKRRKLVSIERVPARDLQPSDVLHVSLPEPEVNGFDHLMYNDGFKTGDRALLYLDASVTEKIFGCNPGQKASWIAGLFDAAGDYKPVQHLIRLVAEDESFLRNVARLLEELGILAGVSKTEPSNRECGDVWQLVVMSEFNSRFAEIIPTMRMNLVNELDYVSYRDSQIKVLSVTPDCNQDVFCCDVKFEEHSFMAEGVIISNCTEVTSSDDSDICNLGSINMSRIETLEDMKEVVELGTMFLLAGTLYSDVPYEKVAKVREKNRRLGLGLMGLHEWLLKHGKKYGPDEDLGEFLEIYATSTEIAHRYADEWGISRPVKTRAIAPTGTIGIVAETTTGIEPIFCVAYKRRYLKGDVYHYQYVVDPCAKRLIESGIPANQIEDAYTLAEDVERRVAFQAWVQKYVDHSISSTINLPAWGSELNNDGKVREFGEMLYKYLPYLRGVTVYPDGARGGQPLTPVRYQTAIKHIGEIFVEQMDVCDLTKGGSCGE